MKLIINQNQLDVAPEIFLKKAGYAYNVSNNNNDDSFIRCLSRNYYPRFHVYIERAGEDIILNLHLDQKKPSYQGSHAHNGEYEGDVIENEIERLKAFLSKNS